MQKKIIALAVAAAFSAPAFAETTVYGIVDAAVINKSVTGLKSSMFAISGGLSGSRIGVKVTEGLDNGMTAVAVAEYKLATDTSDGVGTARQEMLALAGDFGTVAAGYLQTAGYDWQVKFDPLAGSAISPLQNVNAANLIGTTAVAARLPHALAYISPDMNGLTLAANYTTNLTDALVQPASGATTGNKVTAMMLSATYAQGPLSAGVVYAGTASDDNGYAKTTDMAFAGSYDMGVAKLMGTFQTNKTDGGAGTNNALSLSAVAPFGPGAVVASFAKNSIAGGGGNDDSSFTAAYVYNLSKSTTAYGALNQINAKAANVATDTTILAVGLRKKF